MTQARRSSVAGATPTPSNRTQRIADALGSDETLQLTNGRPIISPDALTAIAERVGNRLVSSGGRPTNPEWEISRQVPFSVQTWDRLGAVAKLLSANGRKVARGQIAAMLVETGLASLQQEGETDAAALDAFVASLESNDMDPQGSTAK